MANKAAIFEKVENALWEYGPSAMYHLALFQIICGVILSCLVYFHGETSGLVNLYPLLVFLALASLCFGLSKTLKVRHKATLPLFWIFSVVSFYLLKPSSNAAEGISPYLPTLVGIYAIGILEFALLIISNWFLFRLWQQGRFDGNPV